MSDKKKALTIHEATYNLLRKLGLTTIFGNPGSTEQPFLKNFPADFEYVLGLQEATAVAMADGFAQARGNAALLNLHTSGRTGNGMGNIRDPDLGPDFCIDQEKEMSRLGCVSVAAGVTLNLRCHSYNFQFFLQMGRLL